MESGLPSCQRFHSSYKFVPVRARTCPIARVTGLSVRIGNQDREILHTGGHIAAASGSPRVPTPATPLKSPRNPLSCSPATEGFHPAQAGPPGQHPPVPSDCLGPCLVNRFYCHSWSSGVTSLCRLSALPAVGNLGSLSLELLSALPFTRQQPCDTEGGGIRPDLSATFPEQATQLESLPVPLGV